MGKFKTIEIRAKNWDSVYDEAKQRDAFILPFKAAWKDLLEDQASKNSIVTRLSWERTPDYATKLATLYQLFGPLFEESIKNAMQDSIHFNGDKFERLLKDAILHLSEQDKTQINQALISFRAEQISHESLLEDFLEQFNHNFLRHFMSYSETASHSPDFPVLTGMQPYKLHLSLPLKTHFVWSRDAAKRIYPLLKEAVEEGVLHHAKCIRNLTRDLEEVDFGEREKYSQFTLYLPDPLDIEKIKNLISKINHIAMEEGVYHDEYEEKCDTHISGIVSLRYDFLPGQPYKPADQFTPADLAQQNQLPVIQQLKTAEEKENQEEFARQQREFLTYKQQLHDFYSQIKPAMKKGSQKTSAFNEFSALIAPEKLKKSDVRTCLRLLLKILLQCRGYNVQTVTGKLAVTLLASGKFPLLREIIGSRDKLDYNSLTAFAIPDDKKQDASFFSAKNQLANLADCHTEIARLKFTRK